MCGVQEKGGWVILVPGGGSSERKPTGQEMEGN